MLYSEALRPKEERVSPRIQNMSTIGLALTGYAAALLFKGPGTNMLLLAGTVAALLLWASLSLWQDLGETRLDMPQGWAPWLMAVMFSWLLLSTLWSHWQQVSIYFAWILGSLPLAFLLWLRTSDQPDLWERLWLGLLVLTLGAGLWGLVEYVMTAQRANGPFLDFNSYAALFYLFLFPTFFRYLTLRTETKANFWHMRAYELIFVILLASLFATYSRGAIGALLLMLPLTLTLALRHYGRSAFPALLTLLVIGGATYGAVVLYPEEPINRKAFQLAEDSSFQSRLYMWQSTWEIYKAHPVLGTGLGTYKSQYSAYRDPDERQSSGDLAHNDYLQVLQEGGPILLAFFLALGILTLWLLYRNFRLLGNAQDAALEKQKKQQLLENYGLLIGVLALFAHAVVNFIFYVLPLSLLAGLYLAQAYRRCASYDARPLAIPARATVSRTALVTILILPITSLTVDGVTAAVFLKQPPSILRQALAPDAPTAYRFAQTMASLRPNNIWPAMYLAEANRRAAEVAQDPNTKREFARRARDEYVRALGITQQNAQGLTELARLLVEYEFLHADMPPMIARDPEGLLRQAIRVQPTYELAYLILAELYENQGAPKKAYMLLAQDAMAWFVSPLGSRERRIEIVEKALDLAMQLEDYQGVRILAASLLANEPDHAGAKSMLERLSEKHG